MKLKIICLAFLLNITISNCSIFNLKLKNSCPTYNDYYSIWFNKNCFYEPDVFATTPEILERHVGNFETHEIETDDGYYLTVFRIAKENPKGVIVMAHCIGSDSVIFVGQSNNSLAFVLSEAGYDIWILNFRGTFYSMKHKNKKISSKEYWDFSYQELAMHDLPAVYDYVKSKTNVKKLIVVGYSLGSLTNTVYSALTPTHASNSVEAFILMGPFAYPKNAGAFRYYAKLLPILVPLSKLFGQYSLYTPDNPSTTAFHLLTFLPFKRAIVAAFNFHFGNSGDQFDLNLINLGTSLNLRGFSWKMLQQLLQQINSGGRFQMFDYGTKKNMELYNSSIPPEYPVENISVPTYYMTGSKDSLATVDGVEILYSKLRNEVKIFGNYTIDGFNHIDYVFGKDKQEKVHKPILNLLDKIYERTLYSKHDKLSK